MSENKLTARIADSLSILLELEGYAAVWWITERGGVRLVTNASSQVTRSIAALLGAT